MMRIVWSLQSLADLEASRDYIARDAPVAGQRLVEALFAKAEGLIHHPQSGGFVEEDHRKVYRQLLHGNYRLIYRVDQATNVIRVVTVIHAARLLDPHQLN